MFVYFAAAILAFTAGVSHGLQQEVGNTSYLILNLTDVDTKLSFADAQAACGLHGYVLARSIPREIIRLLKRNGYASYWNVTDCQYALYWVDGNMVTEYQGLTEVTSDTCLAISISPNNKQPSVTLDSCDKKCRPVCRYKASNSSGCSQGVIDDENDWCIIAMPTLTSFPKAKRQCSRLTDGSMVTFDSVADGVDTVYGLNVTNYIWFGIEPREQCALEEEPLGSDRSSITDNDEQTAYICQRDQTHDYDDASTTEDMANLTSTPAQPANNTSTPNDWLPADATTRTGISETETILYGTIGGLLFVILVGVVIIILWCRMRRRRKLMKASSHDNVLDKEDGYDNEGMHVYDTIELDGQAAYYSHIEVGEKGKVQDARAPIPPQRPAESLSTSTIQNNKEQRINKRSRSADRTYYSAAPVDNTYYHIPSTVEEEENAYHTLEKPSDDRHEQASIYHTLEPETSRD